MNKHALHPSSAYRYILCPGSFWAEQHLTSHTDAVASNGQENHRVIGEIVRTGKTAEELGRTNPRDIWLCDEFAKVTKQIMDGANSVEFEVKLQLMGYNVLPWLGTADVVGFFFLQKRCVIIDYKTGFAEQLAVDSNPQLRLYAAMAVSDDSKCSVETYLFSAGERGDKHIQGPTLYAPADIVEARRDAERISNMITTSDIRTTGDHCRYCRANGRPDRCIESCNTLSALPQDIFLPIAPADMARYLIQGKRVSQVIRRIESVAKEMIQQGAEIPCVTLKAGSKAKTITDVGEAFRLMNAHLGTDPAGVFLSACSVSLPDLASAAYQAAKADGSQISQKEMRSLVEGVLATVISEQQRQPSLVIE